MILCLAYVLDDGLKAFLVVDIESASTLSPPFLAIRHSRRSCAASRRRRSCRDALSRRVHQALNCSGSPWVAVARHDDVHMVRAVIDGVESPPPHPAMIGNGRFDEPALVLVEKAASSVRRACTARLRAGSGSCQPWRSSTHPRSSPGSQVPTWPDRENRPRVRAKAVRNHVSLCFSSVSRAPGPSMSPLIMSHINRTRPRQGLQLVIWRVAGSQISHVFRHASAGSEQLPSLAHRLVCSSMRNFLPG